MSVQYIFSIAGVFAVAHMRTKLRPRNVASLSSDGQDPMVLPLDPIGSLKLADEPHLDSTLPILLPVLFSAISAKAFRLSCAVKLSMSFLGKNIKHQK